MVRGACQVARRIWCKCAGWIGNEPALSSADTDRQLAWTLRHGLEAWSGRAARSGAARWGHRIAWSCVSRWGRGWLSACREKDQGCSAGEIPHSLPKRRQRLPVTVTSRIIGSWVDWMGLATTFVGLADELSSADRVLRRL